MRALDAWKSFAPGGRLDALEEDIKKHATHNDDNYVSPKNKVKKLKTVSQSKVKSLNDSAFTSANQATINLMRQSHPADANAAQPLEDIHKHSVTKNTTVKMRIKKRSHEKEKDDLAEEEEVGTPLVETTTTVFKPPQNVAKRRVILMDREQREHHEPRKDQEERKIIEELEEHIMREDDQSLFAVRTPNVGRPTNDVIIATPSQTEVLRYARQFDENSAWFVPMMRKISSSERTDFPDVPVLSRKVLITLLREPDPRVGWERPCCNLDHNPLTYEGRMRCIAHIMSEELLGPGKGFRLREMLMPDTIVAINNAISSKGNPMDHLTPINEMCYLCHLWTTLRDCTEQRDRVRQREQERKDLTNLYPPENHGQSAEDEDNVVIINRFMVVIDQLNEYDRTKIISGDQASMGLWGPVPLFNRTNYIYTTNYPYGPDGPTGLRGFIESDKLLFRPARVSSDRMSSSQRTFSIQSTHTQHVSLTSLSRK